MKYKSYCEGQNEPVSQKLLHARHYTVWTSIFFTWNLYRSRFTISGNNYKESYELFCLQVGSTLVLWQCIFCYVIILSLLCDFRCGRLMLDLCRDYENMQPFIGTRVRAFTSLWGNLHAAVLLYTDTGSQQLDLASYKNKCELRRGWCTGGSLTSM